MHGPIGYNLQPQGVVPGQKASAPSDSRVNAPIGLSK